MQAIDQTASTGLLLFLSELFYVARRGDELVFVKRSWMLGDQVFAVKDTDKLFAPVDHQNTPYKLARHRIVIALKTHVRTLADFGFFSFFAGKTIRR